MARGNSPRRLTRMKEVIARKQFDLTVILENVHDAHNIGAVLRSCESIGIQEVYLLYTEEHLYKKNMKLGKRTSSGARKWLDVFLTNDLEACVQTVKEKYQRLLGTRLSEESDSLFDLDLTLSTALVFGNEKKGISADLSRHLDGNYIIPQVGFVESLNISVACAVSLYEVYRQREQQGNYDLPFDPANTAQKNLFESYSDRASLKGYGRKPQKTLDQ